MSRHPHFTPALFAFCTELSRNNNREWFLANRQRYEQDVRDPLLRFIADFAPYLRRISPRFVADPRPVGGSMFRIYRDTRFARDKRPYKTVASAQFRHERGKDVHAPGFYLHLEPRNVFAAVGMWHPDAAALRLVRDAIVERPAQWRRATGDRRFRDTFDLDGDSLSRPPRGYDPGHPLIEDLKRKDFVGVAEFAQEETYRADFLERYVETVAAARGFMAFLARAVGLPF